MFRILRAAFCALVKLNVMSPTLSKPRTTLWPADESTCFYMAEIFRNGCKINCKHNSASWRLACVIGCFWARSVKSGDQVTSVLPFLPLECPAREQPHGSTHHPVITPTLVLIMNISVYSTGFQGFSASYRKWTPCYHMEIWLTEGYTETDSYLIRKPTNHQQFGSSVSTILQY